jgi:hypothetical protein
MFGFKTFKEAKAAEQALTAAFKARGYPSFIMINSTIHEAMIKQAIFEGVEHTMEAFELNNEAFNASTIIWHYKAISMAYDEKLRNRR